MTGNRALVSAMSRAEFYPHRPADVEVRQTHISHVFLAGELVYKLKKPVRLAFLDYSTLEKRLHYCEEEVRLNRRLAPETYQGVVPVVLEGRSFRLAAEKTPRFAGRAEEYVVQMRRLPSNRMLDGLLRRDAVSRDDLLGLADTLASFHEAAEWRQAALYGTPEAIAKQVNGNMAEIEPFVGRTFSERLYQTVQKYNREFVAAHAGLLGTRLREGKIREGHGDLRTEHVCMEESPVVFDCVEFNEGFRYGDVASEIAFLTMDCDFLGAGALGGKLATGYAARTADRSLWTLLPFYKCYRACVRGKVESIKAEEKEVPEADRIEARARAERYFHLAYRYTRRSVRSSLIIVCGLTGTGKSTAAQILTDLTGFSWLRSDRIRKELAGVGPGERMRTQYGAGIYGEPMTRRTYKAMLEKSDARLAKGKGVIVDATFGRTEYRRWFVDLAAAYGVPVLFVHCEAGEKEVQRRLARREGIASEISDATRLIYNRQRMDFAPMSLMPEGLVLKLDTEDDLREHLERLEESFL